MSVRQYTSYDAKIDPTEDGGVEITFRNFTGHRIKFFVDGGPTPVYVELDGNTTHSMPSRIDKFISVHIDDADGELLATTKWDADSKDALNALRYDPPTLAVE